MHYLAGVAGVIEINGTVIVELITFLLMMAILARYVYPVIVKQAEARQRTIAEHLREAERSRADAEAQLKEATARLDQLYARYALEEAIADLERVAGRPFAPKAAQ